MQGSSSLKKKKKKKEEEEDERRILQYISGRFFLTKNVT